MMALRAFRHVRNVSHAPAIAPVLFRHAANSASSQQPSSTTKLAREPTKREPKRPRRKWMSVADLVEEVESALAKGVVLQKDGPSYANLNQELFCVRTDNDILTEGLRTLKETRAKHVADEERAVLKQDDSLSKCVETLDEVVDACKKIQKIDYELAALNNQKKHNVQDVGILKFTKSRIELDGRVIELVNRVDECLADGEILAVDGPEAKSIKEVIRCLQDEYSKVSPKIISYGKARTSLGQDMEVLNKEVAQKMSRDSMERGRAQEIDLLRYRITELLQQDQRMLAQLGRLRMLQKLNIDYICRLERAQAKLRRYAKVHRVVDSEDPARIRAKADVLIADLVALRTAAKEIESKLDAHVEDGDALMINLRKLKDVFSPEAGKQREQLIANIHQEEQWKTRLAVLRGESIQKLRLLTTLQSALPM